jgi:tripartite-type tricarboxylate transporter receptor subunit TctC
MTASRRSFLAASLLGLCLCPQVGWSEGAFPSQPVTLVVPFPAGGVVDLVARRVGQKMSVALSTTVIVENKPGAGGTLGAAYVSKAKADGYTLLVGGAATQVFGPALYKTVKYDALHSFAPIGQISSGPLVVLVNAAGPIQTIPELLAFLRTNGARAFYGSNGNGTHGLATAHVPYSGGPAAMTALVTNDIALSINHIPVAQGLVKSGRIRALATTGKKRSVAFPNLPTLDESGMKGFEANAWYGLFAPAGTPAAVVQRLSDALAAALKDDSVKAGLEAQGDEASFSTPKEFAAYLEAESAKWTKVVKTTGVKVD